MIFEQEVKNKTLLLRLSGDLIGEDNGANILDKVNTAI